MRVLAKLLIVTLVLNVLALALYAGSVKATVSTNESDTMTRQKISVASSHTIAFTLSGSETFAAGETIIVDFNEDAGALFVVAGAATVVTDFDITDGTTVYVPIATCDATTDDVSFSVNDTTGVVTFTSCTSTTASTAGATMTIKYGTAATVGGAGVDRVTNPGTAGSKEINVSGTFGDDAFDINVPIVDDDQVSVSATVGTNITFDLDIDDSPAGAHADSNTPYSIDLQALDFSTLTNEGTTSVSEIYIDLTTNADGGAVVQVKSANGNLSSASTGDNVPSTTATNATSSTNGNYGVASIQQAAATEGTLTPVSPFNVHGTANAVGALTTSFQTIFNTGSAPIVDADGEVAVRAVAGTSTQAADDYSDTLTFIATATF